MGVNVANQAVRVMERDRRVMPVKCRLARGAPSIKTAPEIRKFFYQKLSFFPLGLILNGLCIVDEKRNN